MAKKIRFPLIMDNEREVKTIEELREFFSAERVIEYLKNGQLVVWLNDRYLNDIAEKVSAIDANNKNAENQLRRALGMEYEETEEEVSEELVIRSRKMGRLKEYTNEKRYFDVVDDMAFDQDELYDLLDDGKQEIYLCGDRFYIPLSVKNMKYHGVNKPVAVIDSKERVDFESRNISFENISFDERYCSIIGLDNAAGQHEETVSEDNDDTAEAGSGDSGILSEYASDLAEFVSDFSSEGLDFDFQELCDDYDVVEEPDCDDYDNKEYDYEMKSEVQSACKEALETVAFDLRNSFEEIVGELKNDSLEKLEDVPELFYNFADDFSDAYFEYAEDHDLDDETKAYIKECYENSFSAAALRSKIDSYNFDEKAEAVFDKAFGNKNIGLEKSKKYRDLCDYDKDDDSYCYDISDAVEAMTDDVNSYIDNAVFEFTEKIEKLCGSVKDDLVKFLLSQIDEKIRKY